MKKDSSSSDPKVPLRFFRRSFSRSSRFGSSSRSPERVCGIASHPLNDSKASFTLTNSVPQSHSEPVREEDYADSDTSQGPNFFDEETKAAESIYSVIQEYDVQVHRFRFNEEFDDSDEAPEDIDTTPLTPIIQSSIPFSIPEESQFGEHDQGPFFQDLQDIPQVEQSPIMPTYVSRGPPFPLPEDTQSPAVNKDSWEYLPLRNISPAQDILRNQDRSNRFTDVNLSLSSEELLDTLGLAVRTSQASSNRNSANSDRALQITNSELSAKFPAVAYSLHETNNPFVRRSVHERPQATLQTQRGRHEKAVPILLPDGKSLAHRVSLLASSHSGSSRNRSFGLTHTGKNLSGSVSLNDSSYGHIHPASAGVSNHRLRGSLIFFANVLASSGSTPGAEGTTTNMFLPRVCSHLSETMPEDESKVIDPSGDTPMELETRPTEKDPFQSKNWTGDASTSAAPKVTIPYIPSPTPSVTRDSEERRQAGEAMFRDEKDWLEKYCQQAKPLSMPWSKWLFMMVAALVVVSIFFLLPFGAFDSGGLAATTSEALPLDEKAVLRNWRFRRRYTRVQKVISFVLGIVWVAIVLTMIGIGFGIGLR